MKTGRWQLILIKFSLILLALFSFQFAYAGNNSGLVYQGRIIKPNGQPLEGLVQFNIAIYSAADHCLLYSETHSNVDMSNTLGTFSIYIGTGSRTDGGAHTFRQVFVNAGTLSGLTCTSGNSFTPAATEDRILEVGFNDGSGAVVLAPQSISSVPYAQQATQISGYGISNLARISTVGGSAVSLTQNEYEFLKNITAPATVSNAPCAANQILKMNPGGTAWTCAADATSVATNSDYNTLGSVAFDTNAATSGMVYTGAGTGIARVNMGTGANQIVQLNGSGQLPAVSGALLTGLSAGNVTAGTLSVVNGGTGSTTALGAFNNLSPLTTKGDILARDTTNNIRLPVGTDGQVLMADSAQSSGLKWTTPSAAGEANTASNQGVGGVGLYDAKAAADLQFRNINAATGSPMTVTLDAGNKEVDLDIAATSGQLLVGNSSNLARSVAMSGDATITNLGTVTVNKIQNRAVASTAPTNGQTLSWNNALSQWEPSTAAATGVTNIGMTVPSFLSVTPTSVSSSGTFAVSLANQNANLIFAGPASGGAAAPDFRLMALLDLPWSVAPGNNQLMLTNGTGSAVSPLSMTSGQMIVGNASGVPSAVSMSGDATITALGTVTVAKIQNRAVASTAPTNGQLLAWNNALSQWEPQTAAASGGSSSGTAGHVQFSDGSGGFSSDSNQLFWDATNNRLGIGTSGPTGSAGLSGGLTADTLVDIDMPTWAANDDVQLRVGDLSLNSRKGGINEIFSMTTRGSNGHMNLRAGGHAILQADSNDLNFRTTSSGTQRMVIKNTGEVGIGNITPVALLDLNGDFIMRGAATGTYAVSPASQGRIFYDSTLQKFRVSQNGAAYVDLVGSGGIGGSGTANYLPVFTAGSTLGNSGMYDNGAGSYMAVTRSQLSVGNLGAPSNGTSTLEVRTSSNSMFRINSSDGYIWEMNTQWGVSPDLIFRSTAGGGNIKFLNAALDMNTTNKVINLADPTAPQDAATKNYVDTNFVSGSGTRSANTVFAGPTTGPAATPTFRSMVLADLPWSVAPGNNQLMLTNGTGTALSPLSMTSGQMILGSASGVPSAISMSGDTTITALGTVTVGKIQNRSVASTAPSNGQILTWNNTTSQWEPQAPGASGSGWSNSGNNYTTGSVTVGGAYNGNMFHVYDASGTRPADVLFEKDSGAWGGSMSFNDVQTGTGRAYNLYFLTGGTLRSTIKGGQDATASPFLGISVNNIDTVTVKQSSVGIATISPTALLEIGTSGMAGSRMIINAESGSTTPGINILNDSGDSSIRLQTTSGLFSLGVDQSDSGKFKISASGGLGSSDFLTMTTGGSLGIGTTSPATKLHVSGGALAVSANAVTTGTTTVDWNQANIQHTPDSCGNFTFNNLQDGGSYTFVVKGSTSAQCNFTSAGLTYHYSPANDVTTASSHTVYTFFRAGSDVYVSWVTGL